MAFRKEDKALLGLLYEGSKLQQNIKKEPSPQTEFDFWRSEIKATNTEIHKNTMKLNEAKQMLDCSITWRFDHKLTWIKSSLFPMPAVNLSRQARCSYHKMILISFFHMFTSVE